MRRISRFAMTAVSGGSRSRLQRLGALMLITLLTVPSLPGGESPVIDAALAHTSAPATASTAFAAETASDDASAETDAENNAGEDATGEGALGEGTSAQAPGMKIEAAGTGHAAPTRVHSPHARANGDPTGDLKQTPRTNSPGVSGGTFDFGAGPVPATRHTVYLELARTPGKTFSWQTPLQIRDSFSLSRNGQSLAGLELGVVVNGTSSGVELTTSATAGAKPGSGAAQGIFGATGSIDLTLTKIPARDSVWVNLDFWLADSQTPYRGDGEAPVVVTNKVQRLGTWLTSDGAQILPDSGDSGPLERWWGIPGRAAVHSSDIVSATDGSGASLEGELVARGNLVASEVTFRPLLLTQMPPGAGSGGPYDWKANGTRDLAVSSFWDPTEFRLDSDHNVVVTGPDSSGSGRETLTPGTDFAVSYTTQPGNSAGQDPETLVWRDAADFTAAELAGVRGARITYLRGGGDYTPSHTSQEPASFDLIVRTPLKATVGSPESPSTADTATVWTNVRALTAAGTGSGNQVVFAPRAQDHTVLVRAGGAVLEKRGEALDAAGNPIVPSSDRLTAGGKARYTLTPALTPLSSDPANKDSLRIRHVTVTDCLPSNIVEWGAAQLDPRWRVAESGSCGTGGTELRFTWQGEAHYADPLAPIVYDVVTDREAPAGGTFTNSASISADTVFGPHGTPAATAEATLTAKQPGVPTLTKQTTTPETAPDGQAEYSVDWDVPDVDGSAVFVDVLPFNGDGRGTQVSGPVHLTSATAHVTSGGAAALEYTVDPAVRLLGAGVAPANGVTWLPLAGASAADLGRATAVRATVPQIQAATASAGSLALTLSAPQARHGDTLANTATAAITLDQHPAINLASGTPVAVTVSTASQTASLHAEKTAVLSADGSRVGYEITITNTGAAVLEGVTVKDEMPGLSALEMSWPGAAGVLPAGGKVVASADYTIADADRGKTLTNEARAAGNTLDGRAVVSGVAVVNTEIPESSITPGAPGTPGDTSGSGQGHAPDKPASGEGTAATGAAWPLGMLLAGCGSAVGLGVMLLALRRIRRNGAGT